MDRDFKSFPCCGHEHQWLPGLSIWKCKDLQCKCSAKTLDELAEKRTHMIDRREIKISRRSNDWHAHFDGDLRLWGCGKTMEEAIQDVRSKHPESQWALIEFYTPAQIVKR